MQIQVRADSDQIVEQASQLLRFYLAELEGDVDRIIIGIDYAPDRLGVRQYRCQVGIRCLYGRRLHIEETQSDLAPAVTRALDRSIRTLRRRAKLRRHARCA